MSLLPRLELVQHLGEAGVGVDEIHVVLVELANLFYRLRVVRVDK